MSPCLFFGNVLKMGESGADQYKLCFKDASIGFGESNKYEAKKSKALLSYWGTSNEIVLYILIAPHTYVIKLLENNTESLRNKLLN